MGNPPAQAKAFSGILSIADQPLGTLKDVRESHLDVMLTSALVCRVSELPTTVR
jgi:hypothetical protein